MIGLLLLTLAPLHTGDSLRDPIQVVDVVRIEWNVCVNEDGKQAYAQLIWWNTTPSGLRCCGYRMVSATARPEYTFGERHVAWKEDGVTYVVRGLVHGTVTLASEDPEIKDRAFLPTSDRPRLW